MNEDSGGVPIIALDTHKFRQLFHYIAWKVGKRGWLSATELYKIMWLADARSYALTDEPITGATYIREKQGPVPEGALAIQDELSSEGAIRVERVGKTWRFAALISPVSGVLSETELAVVDYWIARLHKDRSGDPAVDSSYDHLWEIARVGEELPFYACFAERVRDPSDQEIAWAREVAERLRLP